MLCFRVVFHCLVASLSLFVVVCVSFVIVSLFECLRNDFPRVRGHLEPLSSYFTSHSEHFAALNVFWLF